MRKKNTSKLPVLALLLTVTILVPLTFGQDYRGTLIGRVNDPTGAVIPAASVQLKNVETGVVLSTTTNQSGTYNFNFIQPGKYELSISATGFSKAVRTGIAVSVSDSLTLNVEMQVSVTETSMNVVATDQLLQTGGVSTGQLIDRREIEELPLAEGTPYSLATLAPGMSYEGNPQFSGPTANGNLANFRSMGAVASANGSMIMMDGSANFGQQGWVAFSPPSLAVQEFKVQTSVFDATQGYTAGANVNASLKSGTNDFHFAGSYFNRDTSRTANTFFANKTGAERSERIYHRGSGVISGPVSIPKLYEGRNRTFFMAAYEKLIDTAPESGLFTVPTDKMRNGDFSEVSTVIYNPFDKESVDAIGVIKRRAFAGNVIPTQLINPVAREFLKYYPSPNQAGLVNNFFSNQTRTSNYQSQLYRIDHTINSNHRIFGKFFRSSNQEDRYNWAGTVNGFDPTKGFEYRTNNGGNLGYTAILNPTTVLDIRFGISQFDQARTPANSFDPKKLRFSDLFISQMSGYQYFPYFQFESGTNDMSALGSQRADRSDGMQLPFYLLSFQPSLTKTWGGHSIKSGYDLYALRQNLNNNGYAGGRFYFDGEFTSQYSNAMVASTGRDLAAFLLGLPTTSSSSYIDNPITYAVQSVYHGFYFQDDWKIRRNLTLNLGLRYEVELGFTERFNRLVRGFDLTTKTANADQVIAQYKKSPSTYLPADQLQIRGGYLFADENNRSAWDADTNNFLPRVGIAWEVTNKTVLRAGFGLFSAPFKFGENNIPQMGFSYPTLFSATDNDGLTFKANLTNPYPNGISPSPGSSQGLLTNFGGAAGEIIPAERKNPKLFRMIFGVQRALPKGFAFESNYVLSRGSDFSVTRNLNYVPKEYLSTGNIYDDSVNKLLETNVKNPFIGLAPGSAMNTASNIKLRQLLTAYPQYTSLSMEEYNGNNVYQSLMTQLQNRFRQGLMLKFSYTYSHMTERITYLNPTDTELYQRLSGIDRPHRFTLTSIYEIPIGKNKKFFGNMNQVLDYVVGGWQINTLFERQSGQPLAIPDSYFDGNYSAINSRVGEKDENGKTYGVDMPAWVTSGFYFHDAAVQTNGVDDPKKQLADGRIYLRGTVLRYTDQYSTYLRHQPFMRIDMSLSKNIRIKEGMNLQFRVEAINAFNSVYFTAPSGNSVNPRNSSFGYVTSQRNLPRDIQLGVKFSF